MKKLVFCVAVACLMGMQVQASTSGKKEKTSLPVLVENKLTPAPYGSTHFGGFLGNKIDLCIENRLMAQDIERVIQPFRDRPDGTWGFRSEFWGKWYTAAMQGYAYAPTDENRAVVDRAVQELIATQDSTGYIGTYLQENHLGEWDIWGRKYVMLGLLAYYDQTQDASVLEAACKVADNLIEEAGPESGVNIAATGWIGWKGLASSSVLEPIALLYQKTGNPRYLEFAEHIIKSWNTPNKLTPTGIRLVQEALSGTPLWKMSGAPKAYEMMSCFEGLCEMYRITGNPLYFEACHKLINTIIRDEIMIVGSASMMEIWCHGKMRQPEPMYQGMETCVTATWMKFLYQMLRLTGDSRYADQLETSLYNALLAAMTPQGEWWSYYSSLMGERVPSHQQFPDVVMSCCVANGPRGLMITPSWAVMTSPAGVTLNLYGMMNSSVKTPQGQTLDLAMETEYPVQGTISTTLTLPESEKFAVSLRIPEWSKETKVKVNGEPYDGYLIPGTYASIERQWSAGDKIDIELDMRARVVEAPSGVGDAAIVRGPIVLAFDSRLIPRRDGVTEPPMYRYEFMGDEEGYIDVELVEQTDVPEIWMTFDVPCKDEAGGKHLMRMCDYVSAGNSWKEGNIFRVWTQQPFDYRHLYTNNLDWRVNVTVGVDRPSIPDIYKK